MKSFAKTLKPELHIISNVSLGLWRVFVVFTSSQTRASRLIRFVVTNGRWDGVKGTDRVGLVIPWVFEDGVLIVVVRWPIDRPMNY
jgi:hypothetical protein